jgi:hypothetical protein
MFNVFVGLEKSEEILTIWNDNNLRTLGELTLLLLSIVSYFL